MLMPKKDRRLIFEFLFKEGVLVAKHDMRAAKHPEIPEVRNLFVIKAMQSLKSSGYVKEQYAWRHFYWYLTNEGIEYLREYLHLPPEIVPATLKRQPRMDIRSAQPRAMDGSGKPEEGDDRQGYRRADNYDKTAEAGAGAAPMEFRAGFGRGRPTQQ